MTDAPTIILVHGFWGGAAHWAGVIPLLHQAGLTKLKAVEMPLTSLADDAERTRKMIAQVGGPVLLVGHSYGGAVITEAGTHPDVVGLVYIAAFAPDAGESPGGITQANPPAGAAAIAPDSDGFLWIAQDQYHANFCQDLPEDRALVMAVTQKAPLGSTFGNTISQPAWKSKPCWYQLSEQDRMIAPANQEMMASRMAPTKLIRLAASHASLASQPDAVAALIIEAAQG